MLFNELLFTTKLYMRDLTQIEPEWLPELAPHFFAAHQGLAAGAGHLAGAGGAGGRGEPSRCRGRAAATGRVWREQARSDCKGARDARSTVVATRGWGDRL